MEDIVNTEKPTADLRTADERQAAQVEKIPDDERARIDKDVANSHKRADEQLHADRLHREKEDAKARSDKLFIGRREVTIVRKAEPTDLDFIDTVACSVVKFADDGSEQVVQDKDIRTTPTMGTFV